MKRFASPISFIVLILTVYFSFYSLMPQKYTKNDADVAQFSTERALVHLEKISQKPHYVGAENHSSVRDYIVQELQKMGITAEIQEQLLIEEPWKSGMRTQNILARIKGSSDDKALLLLSHYDSSLHSSVGASDAGSGVVTILEGIRAFLAQERTPKNDIIIVITDGEELGLFGAQSFVKHHPWAKEVGLVLNFEARGSGGPSYMLIETNGGNKKLIEEFNKANVPYPVATSLAYSIYKMIPNDTDLTIFREDGNIEGFNFAFIDDHFDYHTAQDNVERLDKNTLEHQGSYLMPLLNYFANNDLSNLKAEDDYIYFNFPFIGLIYYPYAWIVPILVITIVLFLALLFIGISRKKISLSSVFKGFIPLLVSLIICGLFGYYGWKLISLLHPEYSDIQQGFPYNGYLYIAAFISVAISICFIVYKKWLKKHDVKNLYIAPIILWILVNIALFLYLKGASFFIITIVYALVILTILLFSKNTKKNQALLFTILAVPLLIVMAPMVKIFPVALGTEVLYVSTIFIALYFAILLPVFANYTHMKMGRLFLSLGIIILITASVQSSFNEDRKKPNSINYVLDIDKNEAYFTTYSSVLDDFLEQFLGESPEKGHYDGNQNSYMKYHKKTDVKNIATSEINIKKDTIIGGNRHIDFSLIPQRKISRLLLSTKDTVGFLSYAINGHEFTKKEGEEEVFRTLNRNGLLNYYLSEKDSVVNIQFSVKTDKIPKIELLEIGYDLLTHSEFDIKPRSNTMMPIPFTVNDAIMVKKQIDFTKNEP